MRGTEGSCILSLLLSPSLSQTSNFRQRKSMLRDTGNPRINALTADPYPQPGKPLIYNPTWETTGKQQEVIVKGMVAKGSKYRGCKHVPIKVQQLQKNHKGAVPFRVEQEGGGTEEEEEEGKVSYTQQQPCGILNLVVLFCSTRRN